MVSVEMKSDKVLKNSVRFKYEGPEFSLAIYMPIALLKEIDAGANSTIVVTVDRTE